MILLISATITDNYWSHWHPARNGFRKLNSINVHWVLFFSLKEKK
jgi:hypothetical protein